MRRLNESFESMPPDMRTERNLLRAAVAQALQIRIPMVLWQVKSTDLDLDDGA
jgi:hypothetical protein